MCANLHILAVPRMCANLHILAVPRMCANRHILYIRSDHEKPLLIFEDKRKLTLIADNEICFVWDTNLLASSCVTDFICTTDSWESFTMS
jgi:hypothetical protein